MTIRRMTCVLPAAALFVSCAYAQAQHGTTPPVRTAGADSGAANGFDLLHYDGNSEPSGIVYANARFYIVDDSADKVFFYCAGFLTLGVASNGPEPLGGRRRAAYARKR